MRLSQYIKNIAISSLAAALVAGCSDDDTYYSDPSYKVEYLTHVSNVNENGCDISVEMDYATFSYFDEEIVGSGVVVKFANGNNAQYSYFYSQDTGIKFSVKVSGLSAATKYSYRPFLMSKTHKFFLSENSDYAFVTEGIAVDYEAEDLGLSVKWSNKNLGASSATGVGGCYLWGETKPAGMISSVYNRVGYEETSSMLYNKGIVDKDGNLTPEYDAATQALGEGWRTPTYNDFSELFTKCTAVFVENGIQFTGPNGKSIILPYSGECKLLTDSYPSVGNSVYMLLSSKRYDQSYSYCTIYKGYYNGVAGKEATTWCGEGLCCPIRPVKVK